MHPMQSVASPLPVAATQISQRLQPPVITFGTRHSRNQTVQQKTPALPHGHHPIPAQVYFMSITMSLL